MAPELPGVQRKPAQTGPTEDRTEEPDGLNLALAGFDGMSESATFVTKELADCQASGRFCSMGRILESDPSSFAPAIKELAASGS